jgi:transposase
MRLELHHLQPNRKPRVVSVGSWRIWSVWNHYFRTPAARAEKIRLIAPHKYVRRRENTQDGRELRRYCRRWKIERLFAWLHNFRRLVSRWEYQEANFLGMVRLGCLVIPSEAFMRWLLLVFWGITLALVGPLFGVVVYAVPRSYVSTAQLASAGAVGAVVGGLIGLAFGALHLNYLRRRLDGFRLRGNDAPD